MEKNTDNEAETGDMYGLWRDVSGFVRGFS